MLAGLTGESWVDGDTGEVRSGFKNAVIARQPLESKETANHDVTANANSADLDVPSQPSVDGMSVASVIYFFYFFAVAGTRHVYLTCQPKYLRTVLLDFEGTKNTAAPSERNSHAKSTVVSRTSGNSQREKGG